MFKFVCVFFLAVLSIGASSINYEEFKIALNSEDNVSVNSAAQWKAHLMDFLLLIDINKLTAAILQNINDPEVINFVAFLLGPDFKNLVWELESIPEFKEAASYLSEQGYEVEILLDELNTIMQLPPYEKPARLRQAGVSGLIKDIFTALPIEEMKNLFQYKIKKNPDFAKLVEDLTSEEFLKILKRLSKNPKFEELITTLENNGIDFEQICELANQVLGDDYKVSWAISVPPAAISEGDVHAGSAPSGTMLSFLLASLHFRFRAIASIDDEEPPSRHCYERTALI